MKKIVSAILVLIIAAIIWSQTTTGPDVLEASEESSPIEKQEKPQDDLVRTDAWVKFETKIKSIAQNEIPEELLDFAVSIDSLSSEQVKAPVQNVIKSTLDCYEENQCDFEMPEEGEYYDPSEIPALKLLRRQLRIAIELGIDIDESDLLKATTLPNDDVVQSAFTLLIKRHSNIPKKELFDKLEKVEGTAFGQVAAKLLKAIKNDPKTYNELLDAFIRTLEEKDPFTTIEALEAFRGLSIDQSQFEDLTRIMCPWRVRADHNWLAAKKNLEEIGKEQSLTFDSSRICQ